MDVFEENRVLLRSEYGKQLLDVGSMFSIPIFWLTLKQGKWTLDHNGTGFFLDTGSKVLFVTAAHVYQSYLAEYEQVDNIFLQLLNVKFPLQDRLVSDGTDVGIDVATFDVTTQEIKDVGSTVLRGSSKEWPPRIPGVQEGVFFTGFPAATRIESHDGTSFGRYSMFTPVTSVQDDKFTCVFDREYWIKIRGIPPKKFDLGGASGAPALLIEQSAAKVVSWRFVGILYEAARELGEIVMFHHANVIDGDGSVRKHIP